MMHSFLRYIWTWGSINRCNYQCGLSSAFWVAGKQLPKCLSGLLMEPTPRCSLDLLPCSRDLQELCLLKPLRNIIAKKICASLLLDVELFGLPLSFQTRALVKLKTQKSSCFKGFPACLTEQSIRLVSWWGSCWAFSQCPYFYWCSSLLSSGLAPKRSAITEVRCVKLALCILCWERRTQSSGKCFCLAFSEQSGIPEYL